VTAAVARRTVLLAMPALPVLATASPAGFGRTTVAEMFERTRELDRTIGDLLLAGRDDEQDPLQDEWLELVDRIARTAARDLTGVRCKVRLAAEALDTGGDLRAEALLDSVERDLDALDCARSR
jgi:ATP/maltotriose-dependent transcriptional regulator MalT